MPVPAAERAVTEEQILSAGLRELLPVEIDAPGDTPNLSTLVTLLMRYVEELRGWNARIDLLADAGEGLVPRHILDSLAGIPVIREWAFREPDGGLELADLGSGAGLPGIPLALTLPEARVVLVERSGRRAGFLRSTAAVLGLRNTRVVQGRLEELDEGSVSNVVFRALSEMDGGLARQLRRICRRGAVCAYKGRRDAAVADAETLSAYFSEVEVLPLQVPFLEAERHMVVARARRA